MKQYVIMVKDETVPVIVSSNSLVYSEYMMSGYSVIFAGNKKECEDYKDEIICELSNLD